MKSAATILIPLLLSGCGGSVIDLEVERIRERPGRSLAPATDERQRLGLDRMNGPSPEATATASLAVSLPEGFALGQPEPERFRHLVVQGPDGILGWATILAGGSDLAGNLARWHRVLGLPPPRPDEAFALPPFRLLDSPGHLVDRSGSWRDVSGETTIDDARLLAAWTRTGERVVTFLVVGPAAAIRANEAAIRELLGSLRWASTP